MDLYTYKGNLYEILFDKAQVKIGTIWLDAIVYLSLKDGKIYTREKTQFFSKFEKYVK